MEAIVVRSDLYETLETEAKQDAKTVSGLVNEAIEYYLRERHRAKLDQEIIAYEKLYPELKQNHLGQWVAVHNRELVDYDADRLALYRRIRDKFGRIAVLLRQVKETPTEEVWLRTPSTGWNEL